MTFPPQSGGALLVLLIAVALGTWLWLYIGARLVAWGVATSWFKCLKRNQPNKATKARKGNTKHEGE